LTIHNSQLRAAIHQPQYLAYLGFFHKIRHCDLFVVLDNVQFQKNGLQNRNKIKDSSAQGWQWLTVPVQHRFGQMISEVALNTAVPWQRKHWQAILSNYAAAPFFATYGPELKRLLEQEYATLTAVNMALTQWVMQAVGIETPIVYASELNVGGVQTELLVNICRVTGAGQYLSGPGGRQYMDLDAFAAAGIEVVWQEFNAPVYSQLFPGISFIPNLSIIDPLFNCGPQIMEFLR
jgi:hypothetical protein